jgi:hypothetical protein
MNGRQEIQEECLANVLGLLQSPPLERDVESKRRVCIAAGRLAALSQSETDGEWQQRMAQTEEDQLAYAQVLWPRVRAWLGDDGYAALTTGSLEPLIELAGPAAESFAVALTLLHQRLAAAWLLEGLRALWPEQGDFIERWYRGPAGLDRVDDAIQTIHHVPPGYIDEALAEVARFCGAVPRRRSYGPALGGAISKSLSWNLEWRAAASPLQETTCSMKPEQSLLIDDWLRQEHPDTGIACNWDSRIQSPVLEHAGRRLPVLCFSLGERVIGIPEKFTRREPTGAFRLEAIRGFDEDGSEATGPVLAIEVRQLGTCIPAATLVGGSREAALKDLALSPDSDWLLRWMRDGRI